jgi:hypothetical protein
MGADRVIEAARQQGFDFFSRYEATGDPQWLLASAEQFRRSVHAARDADPRKAGSLAHICTLLTEYYRKTKELWALDEAAATGRAAVAIEQDPEAYQTALILLGIALTLKYDATRERAALVESLHALRPAGQAATPARPGSLAGLYHLARALYLAYDDLKEVALLDEAVAAGRPAAKNPHAMQLACLLQLIRHLRELSYVRQDMGLLAEAETAARWGVQITAQADPEDHSLCLFELARTLETVSDRTGQLGYLREALAAADASIRLTQDRVEAHLRSIVAGGMANRLQASGSGEAAQWGSTPAPPPTNR